MAVLPKIDDLDKKIRTALNSLGAQLRDHGTNSGGRGFEPHVMGH